MGNWGKARNWKKHSKQRKCRMNQKSIRRNIIRRLFFANLKLGTNQKFESKNSLSALAILYPLSLQWHKTLNNFELDYTFLLEVSIMKGIVLSFTDDKAKRYEINKRLGRIAATATAAYKKITGRANEQLDKNVKKNQFVWWSIKIMAVGHR